MGQKFVLHDMEMYDNKLQTYYHISDTFNQNTNSIQSTVGPLGVAFYKKAIPDAVYFSPIVDGRTDVGYLTKFNDLSESHIRGYANLVAQQFCADKNANGSQVDVEPVDFTKIQQINFYDQLTSDLAGDNPNTPICDKSKDRYTSIFTFANNVQKGIDHHPTKALKLLEKKNFLVIDSLYDITTDGSDYKQKVEAEVHKMVNLANEHHINFKFGIPASCSFHECGPNNAQGIPNNLSYVKEALAAMKKYNACQSPYFKGVALWGFDNETVTWEGKQYTIKSPSSEVVSWMTTNAMTAMGCNPQ